MDDNSSVTIELLDAIAAAFNNKNPDEIINYFAEDGEMCLAAGPEPCGVSYKGVSEIYTALEERFAAVPDIQWNDASHFIDGDRAVSQWRVQGTAASGAKIDAFGCDVWTFRDGKITLKDTFYKQVVPA